tara:strand:+ start:434 stop:862 length:429 start_codon:yes stop_codon:yes gene_type:complete
MMANTKSILRQIKSKDNDEGDNYQIEMQPERERLNNFLEREEEEKYKDEATKSHERYRRKQKSTEIAMSLEQLIRPAKKREEKPGTYFYGPLKKLAEDFGDISVMLKYMTLGQNEKYSQDGSRLLNRAGQVVYDETSQECFE